MTQQRHRALEHVLATQWAIMPEALETIAAIAEREHEYAGNLHALEAKLGRPLGNTMSTTVRDGVASIPVEGPLFKRASWFQAISGATDYAGLATDLTAAIEDPSVSAIILMIDSPGGEVAGAAELASMIRASTKPVWAYIEGNGASAAYWLASAADKIIASPTAVIGSIGVMMGMTVRDPKAGEKSYRFVSSQSPNKNAGPDTESGAQAMQAIVDDMAQVFVDTVAKHRNVTTATVLDKFGSGGVMVAAKALAAGMIDGVGTYEDALSSLKKETSSMDYSSITAATLAEHRPELVAAFRAEGAASVDAASIRAEATKAERERITAIEALAIPGAEKLIASFKADGTEPAAAAIKIVQHMQASNATSATAALKNIQGAEDGMEPPKPLGSATNDADADEAAKLKADMELLRKSGAIS